MTLPLRLGLASLLTLPSSFAAQSLMVGSETKIGEAIGGFTGELEAGDVFGFSLAALGDLDGDGKRELAIGAIGDDDGGRAQGAVWIVSLNPDGTVAAGATKISATAGGFGGQLDLDDNLGVSLAALGDLDGDGTVELAVGAPADDDGGQDKGAVWILSLNPDATVASWTKISATSGGFVGPLRSMDWFGYSLTTLGDLDGDGTVELAVGSLKDDDGGAFSNRGALWILSLNTNGTVAASTKISETAGGFGGQLDSGDEFGTALASLGDLDADGNVELAVGASKDSDDGFNHGAVWILSLRPDATLAAWSRISEGFGGVLDPNDYFGSALAAPGDLDGDGRPDLVVGAFGDVYSVYGQGAVWLLSLDPDASVASETKFSGGHNWFGCHLGLGDSFGRSVAAPGDLDGDGKLELIVGAPYDEDVASSQGAVWVLSFDALAAKSGTYAGEGLNRDTITPVDAVPGGTWSAPLTIGHPHGSGGPLTLMVYPCTNDGANFRSPVGGRMTEFLLAGSLMAKVGGTHDGTTGDIPPQLIPSDPALLGLSWAAQYIVAGGGHGDYSQAALGIVGP
ncbi:MAG: hypothetical protein ABL998_06095 [Planctomycetota bacterium]